MKSTYENVEDDLNCCNTMASSNLFDSMWAFGFTQRTKFDSYKNLKNDINSVNTFIWYHREFKDNYCALKFNN